MRNSLIGRLRSHAATMLAAAWYLAAGFATGQYLDNQTQYSNQDPNTETRRSDHFRLCFGHYNWDGTNITEAYAQGNLQMYEQMWNRWVNEMGLHDINESITKPDGNKYRTNFNFLMSWNDGGGGGAYSTMDANGFFYSMSNAGNCRFDPPSGATPHEMGHVWEGSCGGFNGTDSSGAWWECTANWMMLQFNNSYPQAGGYIYNGMYYPCHGRDYYDSFMIWETARDDPRYGAAWVNSVWTNYTPDQQAHEYILDRMVRVDSSGSADKAGAMRDLWGDMAKKMVTWDYARQKWLVQANADETSATAGTAWKFYQRCRTPLVKLPGSTSPVWYRPSRDHAPMEYGFNMIPLQATAGTTVSCNFQGQWDPVRQSDWRACLVAVNSAGAASYSSLWNNGTNTISLSADQSKLFLVVIATPKPMKITEPVWQAYLSDAGLQFPYAVSFTNATPKNVIYAVQNHTGMTQHANGGGWKASGATVDATAYLGPNAQVLDSAKVKGYARVEDYAVVRNSAQVRDYAVVSGHAEVLNNAQIYGNAKVRDWGRAFGYVEIYENAKVIEHGNCGDGNAATHTKVYGDAIVKGTAYVYDTSTLAGCLIMEGDSANGNGTTASDHGVHFGWGWGQDTARFAGLTDNGYIYARHSFEKDNAVFAMDEYGINHGFMMNGCRTAKDTVAPTRGGRVLPLDGVSQYVELHNSVNDFRETAYTVWVKWTGSASDQRIWSLGDGANRQIYLTPQDAATGNLRLVVANGATTQYLDGAAAMPANTWTHVAVTFGTPVFNTTTKTWSATGTLYVNSAQVASLAGMPVPDSLNAPLMENANYLGRGNAGNYFQGSLDDFRCYMKSLSAAEVLTVYNTAAPSPITIAADTTAPTPNAATWLVTPTANGDNASTMSATPGSDASGWVEYFFTCTPGSGGHDSGWLGSNKYTDFGITLGTSPSYTVKMRDRNGNTTAESAAAAVTLATSSVATPTFGYGPIGIAGTAGSNAKITMTAATVTSPSGKVEYKFDRTLPTAASSGWQSSETWTNTGLTSGTSYTYTVTVRDGRGNTSSPSVPVATVARDNASPVMSMDVAQWQMQPYATIDNKISMTAQAATDASSMQYYFHCVSGGGPDSAWQTSTTFVTPAALGDGTYVYQYKVRDTSAQTNETGYSTSYPAKIAPTTGYHTYTLAQVLTGADDNLVSFPGTVMKVNSDNYLVKDLATGFNITVKPNKGGGWTPPPAVGVDPGATDATLALKNVTVKGHLYTLAGSRIVTYAALTSTGNPTLYTISGKVINSTGGAVVGATVAFADVANPTASPIVTATTDASGNFSNGVTTGIWYVAVSSNSYNTSADQIVTVGTANVSGINFTLAPNSNITGAVTRANDGTPIVGASVYFSRSAGASAAPVFTVATDASGSYTRAVQDGVWYVAAAASGFYGSTDKTITVNGAAVSGINFALKSNTRNVPQTTDLLFSALTESFPGSGAISTWATYQPSGQTLTSIGTPTVAIVNGAKWASNLYADGDGFLQGTYSAAVPINGATIIVAARPNRNTAGTSWTSIVDLFYNRLVLGIRNSTGKIDVCRNGSWSSSATAIPSGQTTILSLVVQPTGQYKVYANGALVMNETATSDMTSLVPNVPGPYANAFNVGRNNPDGWTTFNGNIGDVFVYKVALADAERLQLETDVSTKFLATDYTITASAGAGGSINPSGAVTVNPGGSQTFTIAPLAGYAIDTVTVDGVSQGALGAYPFTSVTGNHTISATFIATHVPGSQSTVAAAPASVHADGITQSNITVTLRDSNNNPVSGKTVALASSRGATDTISAASGASDGSGVVTFTVRSSAVGTADFTATDVTDGNLVITQFATVNFTVVPVLPTKLAFISVPATGTAGTAFSVTVQSQDAAGNPVNVTSATTVTLSKTGGAGTLSGTLTGVIASGSNSVTIATPVYSRGDTISLTSSTTGGMTLAAVASGNIAFALTSTTTGGAWATTGTWVGNQVPLSTDAVVINGAVTSSTTTVTIAALTINAGKALTMQQVFTVSGGTNISGTINFGSNGGTSQLMTFMGDVTLNSGAVWNETNTGAVASFSFGGNCVNNANTFTAQNDATAVHTFSGTTKTLGGATATVMPYATFNGTCQNDGTLTVDAILAGSGSLTQGDNATLNIGGISTITTLTATGTGNTVSYSGAAQTVKATIYNDLTLSGTLAKTLAAGTVVGGNLSIAPTGSASANVGDGLSLAVGSLSLGGQGRIGGTWGSTSAACPATSKNSAYFGTTATGVVNVVADTRTTPTVASWPEGSALTYGATLGASTLAGGAPPVPGLFNFTAPETQPGAAGIYQASGTFTPTDPTAYLATVVDAAISVPVNPLALAMTGNRTYNRTIYAEAAILTITNVVGGDAISLTGRAGLAERHAASQAITATDELSLVGAQAANYTLTGSGGAVTIGKLPVTVAAVDCTKTYDGTTAATGTPTIAPELLGGDTTSVLAQAYLTISAGVGDKEIVPSITIDDGNGGANYAVTFQNFATGTIDKAAASVVLGNLTQTYDGNPKAVTTATNPSGLAVAVTYNDSSVVPVNQGSYAVAATITDANHDGNTTGILVIQGNTYGNWQTAAFTPGQIDAGMAAETADPDGDGLVNLAEYALGTDPLAFTAPPIAARTGEGLVLTFTRPKGLGDVTYAAESSADMIHWTPDTLELLTDGPVQTLRAVDPLITGDPARRFIRLHFTKP